MTEVDRLFHEVLDPTTMKMWTIAIRMTPMLSTAFADPRGASFLKQHRKASKYSRTESGALRPLTGR